MSVPRRMAQAFSLHDEDGMTTVGMVVSLLLALSMIFSSAQVYRIQSVSSRVQSVADAGALAAGNVVAEFMVAVRVCDSVALSLSLTSLTSTGLGVVACCVPGGQGVGTKLLEAGARVADARDSFSKTASEGLTRIQKALPFLAAASAASVAQGNGSNGSDYTALACWSPIPPRISGCRRKTRAPSRLEKMRSARPRRSRSWRGGPRRRPCGPKTPNSELSITTAVPVPVGAWPSAPKPWRI